MNVRQKEILLYLVKKNSMILIESLAKIHDISQRTIYNDLLEIDEFLKSNSLNELKRAHAHVGLISFEDHDVITELVLANDDSYLNRAQRIKLIILELLLAKDFISIDTLSEKIDYSYNTIVSDTKEIDSVFRGKNISILSEKFKGMKIIGDEVEIRQLFTLDLMSVQNNNFHAIDKLILYYFEKEVIQQTLDILSELETSVSISDRSYYELWIQLLIVFKRIQNGYIIKNYRYPELEYTQEYSHVKEAFEKYEYLLPKDEILYISNQVLKSSTLVRFPDQLSDDKWLTMQLSIKEFIFQIGKHSYTTLSSDEFVYQSLINHIRPAYYRLSSGDVYHNPLLEEIKSKYSTIHKLVMDWKWILENAMDIEFVESEASYLTIIIAASIERNKRNKISSRIIVICHEGLSTSQLIVSQLRAHINADVIEVMGYREAIKNIDLLEKSLVLSTIWLDFITDFIYVDTFLTEADYSIIRKQMKTIRLNEKYDLIKIISKHATINDEDLLRKDINNYFNGEYHGSSANVNKEIIMLKEILNEGLVMPKVSVNNRDEAVRYVGEMLMEEGLIEEQYIYAMLKNIEINGTYIVIAPGIAMPHASSSEGVNGIGISVITLDKPIVFGHEKNDPVELVIGLCSIDNSSHLYALAELMEILSDKEIVTKLKKCTTKNEMLILLKGE